MTIHTRATTYDHGFMPEQLVTMCGELHPRASSWHALARAGRVGYKHCGLTVEVVDGEGHTPEDVAGAVLAMVAKHHGQTGCALYRIDAHDANGDRLGDGLPLRMGEDGADDVADSAVGGVPKWVSDYLKQVQDAHIATLKVVPDVMTIAKDAMEALATAVGEVCEIRWESSGDDNERIAEEHKHERNMAFLSMFAPLLAADRARQAGRSPLADLLATMPDDVKTTLRECIGADFDVLCDAAGEANPEARRERIAAVLGRLTPSQKAALGERIPPEWQTQIQAAFRAELAT